MAPSYFVELVENFCRVAIAFELLSPAPLAVTDRVAHVLRIESPTPVSLANRRSVFGRRLTELTIKEVGVHLYRSSCTNQVNIAWLS